MSDVFEDLSTERRQQLQTNVYARREDSRRLPMPLLLLDIIRCEILKERGALAGALRLRWRDGRNIEDGGRSPPLLRAP